MIYADFFNHREMLRLKGFEEVERVEFSDGYRYERSPKPIC
jgi:hypothetical protein